MSAVDNRIVLSFTLCAVIGCEAEPVVGTGAAAISTPAVPPAQCDATGRTVDVPLRFASSRGHVAKDEVAVYKGRNGTWYWAKNHNKDTTHNCIAEDKLRHSAEATIPVKIKCLPYVPQPGADADPSKPCQAEVDYGEPVFKDIKSTESTFDGRYHLGSRRVRIDALGGGYETIEDYGTRTSSCFYHAGTTYTGAHWCMTKAETVHSNAPKGPLDIDRGTQTFVVGLGASFVHAMDHPNQWNVVLGGGWAGLSYGPVSVGAQVNVTPPEHDESTAWLGYMYVAQCGRDGKPYLVSREPVNAASGTTGLSYDWTPDQAKANQLCEDVIKKANEILPQLGENNDLVGELGLIRSRARARDIDCKGAMDLLAALLRNKRERDLVAAKRAEVALLPDSHHVVALLDELAAWLRSPQGLYAPEAGVKERWDAIAVAAANLDMVATLVGLQVLYPAGEHPVFDSVVAALLAYLRGPGPIDQARVTMDFAVVQARLQDLLRNRLCRTRAVAALKWDEIRWSTDLENKEPYVTKAKEKIEAAKAAISVRTVTCDQVKAITEVLQSDLAKIFRNLRGEKMVTTMKALAQVNCIASNRAAFQAECDALITRMKAIEFADQPAVDAAIAALDATHKRLCVPPPVVIPPEADLPPIEFPPPPPPPEDLDSMLAADDIGDPEEGDVLLARMLGADAWDANGLANGAVDDVAPWLDGDWLAALATAGVDGLLDEAAAAPESVEPERTEQCDLGHDVYPWPYPGCATCMHCQDGVCTVPDDAVEECNASASEPASTEPVSTEPALEPI